MKKEVKTAGEFGLAMKQTKHLLIAGSGLSAEGLAAIIGLAGLGYTFAATPKVAHQLKEAGVKSVVDITEYNSQMIGVGYPKCGISQRVIEALTAVDKDDLTALASLAKTILPFDGVFIELKRIDMPTKPTYRDVRNKMHYNVHNILNAAAAGGRMIFTSVDELQKFVDEIKTREDGTVSKESYKLYAAIGLKSYAKWVVSTFQTIGNAISEAVPELQEEAEPAMAGA